MDDVHVGLSIKSMTWSARPDHPALERWLLDASATIPLGDHGPIAFRHRLVEVLLVLLRCQAVPRKPRRPVALLHDQEVTLHILRQQHDNSRLGSHSPITARLEGDALQLTLIGPLPLRPVPVIYKEMAGGLIAELT